VQPGSVLITAGSTGCADHAAMPSPPRLTYMRRRACTSAWSEVTQGGVTLYGGRFFLGNDVACALSPERWVAEAFILGFIAAVVDRLHDDVNCRSLKRIGKLEPGLNTLKVNPPPKSMNAFHHCMCRGAVHSLHTLRTLQCMCRLTKWLQSINCLHAAQKYATDGVDAVLHDLVQAVNRLNATYQKRANPPIAAIADLRTLWAAVRLCLKRSFQAVGHRSRMDAALVGMKAEDVEEEGGWYLPCLHSTEAGAGATICARKNEYKAFARVCLPHIPAFAFACVRTHTWMMKACAFGMDAFTTNGIWTKPPTQNCQQMRHTPPSLSRLWAMLTITVDVLWVTVIVICLGMLSMH
jgi:hypothetical protein